MRVLPPLARWCVVLASSGFASVSFGQAFVERMSPPSLTRGGSTALTLVGSQLERAVGLWTSSPPGVVRAAPAGASDEGRVEFQVEVAADAPLGLYGLRLATADGLSNVHLFLIDDLPTTAEVERPGSNSPQSITLPAAIAGICGEADVDRYSLEVEAGRRLTFEVVGSRLGQDLDPLVTIYDSHGGQIAARDNDVGLCFDCRFEHTFAEAGTYTVEVRDARFAGSNQGAYVLRIGEFPVARVALPSTVRAGEPTKLMFPQLGAQWHDFAVPADQPPGMFYYGLRRPHDQASVWITLEVSDLAATSEQEPNDTPELAMASGLPAIWHGQLASSSDRDWFALELDEGDQLSFEAESRALGSPACLELVVLDPAGKEHQRVDTEVLGEAGFTFTAPGAGRHLLLVRELTRRGGPEFVYRIKVVPCQPGLEVDSAADNLTIPQGSYQPLPLALRRTEYDGAVELSLVGAPPGMALRSGTVPAAAGQFVEAIVVDGSVPVGVYTVQVAAQGQIADRRLTALAQTRPLIDRLPTGRGPHGEPFELREDQRRLPPSLTDRIAVQVTPAAPFTFELSDALVTLPRYERAEFRLLTERATAFEAPITFIARGGTLEPQNLQAPRVRAEMPPATRDQPAVTGVLRSGVNSELTRHPVTVTGTAVHEQRRISLTRIFDLELQVAFNPSADPGRIELAAGGQARVKLLANRLEPFAGEVTVTPPRVPGLSLPELVVIPACHDGAEVELTVAPDVPPGTYSVAWPGLARVGGFLEEAAGGKLEVVVTAAVGATGEKGGPP